MKNFILILMSCFIIMLTSCNDSSSVQEEKQSFTDISTTSHTQNKITVKSSSSEDNSNNGEIIKPNNYSVDYIVNSFKNIMKNKEMNVETTSQNYDFNIKICSNYMLMKTGGTAFEYYFINNNIYVTMYMNKETIVNMIKNTEVDYSNMSEEEIITYIKQNVKKDASIEFMDGKFILMKYKIKNDNNNSVDDLKNSIGFASNGFNFDKNTKIHVKDSIESFNNIICDVVECTKNNDSNKYFIYLNNKTKEIIGLVIEDNVEKTKATVTFSKYKEISKESDLPKYLQNASTTDVSNNILRPMAILSSIMPSKK